MGKKDKRIRELEAEIAGLKRRIEMLEYQRLWIAPAPNYEPFPYRPSPTVPRPYWEYEVTCNKSTITHASTDEGDGYHYSDARKYDGPVERFIFGFIHDSVDTVVGMLTGE